MTEHAREQRKRLPWEPDISNDDGRADLGPLAEVTGDFYGTLRECQTLLRDRARFGRNEASFVHTVLWNTSAEREVNNLRERVHLHETKLFFAIKPFEFQLLIGIRSQLIQLREEVEVVKGLVVTLHKNDTLERSTFPIHPAVRRVQIPEEIIARFLNALNTNRPESFHDITDFPLKEGFDALVFHFAKSTIEFNPGVGLSQRVPEKTQYINLLKSKWILEMLNASSHLSTAKPDSLWTNYLGEVEMTIVEEYRRFDRRLLVAPPTNDITRLPDSCFSIWVVEVPPVRAPDLSEERILEDKILELTLPSPVAKKLILLRYSEIDLSRVIAETFTDGIHKVVERESFTINMESTRLIPAYTIHESTTAGSKPVNNVLLYRIQDHAPLWQSLESFDDVARFQQALSGYRVFYDSSNIIWSLNDGSKNHTKNGVGRVQTWQVKRLPKMVQNDEFVTGQYSSSPVPSPQSASENNLQQESTVLSSVASYFFGSSMTLTSQVAENRSNSITTFPPEPPVLIIYTLCEEKYTFLHLELSTEIFVNDQLCYCRKSTESCSRLVLGAKKRGKMNIRKLSAHERHEKGLASWDLGRFRLPRHPKFKDVEVLRKVKYICLDFHSVAAKEKFREELALLFALVRDCEPKEKAGNTSQRTPESQNPHTSNLMSYLSISYSELRRRQEALELREKVLEASQSTLGSEHPDTLSTMVNVALS